jgi:hypothetical protein
LRSLAATLGVLCVGAVFLVGRSLHSNLAGLLAAAFTAFSAQQLQYSQFVRGYTLGFLAAAVCLLAIMELARRWRSESPSGRIGPLLVYAGAAWIAFHTHTTFFVLPLLANVYAAWLWLARTPRRWKDAAGWLAANAVLLVACLWWIVTTVRQIEAGAEPIAWIEAPSVRDAAMKSAHVFATRSLDALNIAFAAVFGGFIAWGAWRLKLEHRALAAVFGIGAPLILFLVSLKQPVFMERTIFWLQAIYFPCLAVGLLDLSARPIRAAMVAICLSALLFDAINWRRSDYREPWRDIATILRDQAGPKDAVVAYSADAAVNLDYYCRKLGCSGAKVFALRISRGRAVFADFFKGAEVEHAGARQSLSGFDRIFVMQRGFEEDPAVLLAGFAREETSDLLPKAWAADEALPVNHMKLAVWRPAVIP